MSEILQLIEGYGLPLVLLVGALYALYRFFFFSIHGLLGLWMLSDVVLLLVSRHFIPPFLILTEFFNYQVGNPLFNSVVIITHRFFLMFHPNWVFFPTIWSCMVRAHYKLNKSAATTKFAVSPFDLSKGISLTLFNFFFNIIANFFASILSSMK